MKRPTGTLRSLRRGAPPPGVDFDRLAGTLQEVAEELEAADDRIKRAILAAVDRGDLKEVRRIVQRWRVEPATELAATL